MTSSAALSTSPHLVACDIDGTLVLTGHPATRAVRDAASAVRAAGHHIVIATGRSLVGALPVAEELGLDDVWIVASNGAVTAHLVGRDYEVTERHDVDAEVAIRVAVSTLPGIQVAAEIVGVGYRVNIPFADGELNGEQRSVAGIEQLWANPTPRLALHGVGAYRLVQPLRMLGLTVNETRSDWVDVTAPRISKASALEKVRTELGIELFDTAAIGDGENDIEMFHWARRSIVMGHAPQHVQGQADHATGTITDDGAAAALRSLLS